MFHQIVVPSRRFQYQAQMAESVDALVSNTSGATRAGSTPALGTRKGRQIASLFLHPSPGSNRWFGLILVRHSEHGGLRPLSLAYSLRPYTNNRLYSNTFNIYDYLRNI